MGLFWYDRYKALAEAVLNLGISIVLVKNFGVWGVFAGTFCSTVLTSVWVEPYILYKYRFHRPVKEYFKTYAGYLLMMVAAWSLTEGSCQFDQRRDSGTAFSSGACLPGTVPNLLLWLIFRRTEKWKRLSGLLKRIGQKGEKKPPEVKRMTEQGKKISVIIPAYNAGKVSREKRWTVCLRRHIENWEVILVVTMSEDKTEKVAGEYQRKGFQDPLVWTMRVRESAAPETKGFLRRKGNICFSWTQMIIYRILVCFRDI